jgi:WD40 repeat protein
MGAGAISGAAGYGAYRGVVDADPMALTAMGVGTLGGAGFSATFGGIGLVGSFGGIGLGIGAMSAVGGVVGLGIYGAIKMLDGGSPEPAFQAFSRMEARINDDFFYQSAYTDALIELTFAEDDLIHRFRNFDVDGELQRLKAEVQRQQRQKRTLTIGSSSSSEQVSAAKDSWIEVDTLHHHSEAVNTIAFSPDGQTVFTASDDRTIIWWDLHTGRQLYTFLLAKPVLALAISPNGQTLVAGGLDQTVTSWKLTTKLLSHIFTGMGLSSSHSGFVSSLAFGSDGMVASSSADKLIRLWHTDTGTLKRTLNGHTDTVFSIAISPCRKRLVSGSADRTIRIWNLEGWALPQVLTGHTGWINSVLITPNGKTLISGSSDSTIKLWDLRDGRLHQTLNGHLKSVTSLALSPDGSLLASSSNDGTIQVWKLSHSLDNQTVGEALHTLPGKLLSGKGVVAFSPDGRTIVASGEQGSLKIWNRKNVEFEG